MSQACCRLCGGTLSHRFDGVLLGRHTVRYDECQACGSLQTEQPYWLDEAYAASNLSSLDTGAAQRNLDNLGAVLALARWLGLHRVVDHGGGDGLLVRLLRDRGLDAHVLDRHAAPRYAMGFGEPDTDEPPQLVTAFEVLEHFANPGEDLRALFAPQPPVVLASTDAWEGQGAAWWYLAPDTGQHVFFYSRRALGLIAAQYGYDLARSGGYWLFIHRGAMASWKARLARKLLTRHLRRLRNAWAVTRATPGIWRDHEALASRQRVGSRGGPAG